MLYIPDIGVYSKVIGVHKFREAEQRNAIHFAKTRNAPQKLTVKIFTNQLSVMYCLSSGIRVTRVAR